MNEPGPSFEQTICSLLRLRKAGFYRVLLSADNVHSWELRRLFFSTRTKRCESPDLSISQALGLSAGGGVEWVYVDLGANCTFDSCCIDMD